MLQKRTVLSVIVFSLLTCGIYLIWWTYVTCSVLQQHGRNTAIPPVLTTLMMLFVSGVGGILLGIDADDNINAIKYRYGMPQTDNKVLWLVLGFFIPLATACLVQYEINNMINTAQANGPQNMNGNFTPQY